MALNYGSSTSISFGTALNSLAASTTTGFAQAVPVTTPTANNIVDCQARITLVGAGTVVTPFMAAIFVSGSEDGTTFTDGVSNSTADALTTSANGNNLRFLGTVMIPTAAAYVSEPMSIASAFGGVLPKAWCLVVQNQTGVTLASSGHSASYTAVYYN